MMQQETPAVAIARAHIEAWSHRDWEKTRELLAPNVHAVVTGTQRDTAEFTGIENYMERKKKGRAACRAGKRSGDFSNWR
jgi:ketosteroid isomerase-like protein